MNNEGKGFIRVSRGREAERERERETLIALMKGDEKSLLAGILYRAGGWSGWIYRAHMS